MNDQFQVAAIAIFASLVLDGMDGRIARMTNTQSAFGEQYDSLADMVSFGVAPALVAYEWALKDLGKWGWLAAFTYCAGAALRLARFNVNTGVVDKKFFHPPHDLGVDDAYCRLVKVDRGGDVKLLFQAARFHGLGGHAHILHGGRIDFHRARFAPRLVFVDRYQIHAVRRFTGFIGSMRRIHRITVKHDSLFPFRLLGRGTGHRHQGHAANRAASRLVRQVIGMHGAMIDHILSRLYMGACFFRAAEK